MRRIAFMLVPLALAGCATAPIVVPAGGAPQATSSAGPIALTVFPSQWDGEPYDLTDYVTPVAVELYNAGPDPVRVSYFDFVLTDAAGVRYAALNPFVAAQSRADSPSAGGTLVAWRGGGHFRSHSFGPRTRSARMGPSFRSHSFGSGRFMHSPRMGPSFRSYSFGPRVGMPPRTIIRGGTYFGSPAWRGYSVLPHYRPWLGARAGLRYWNSPFLWPPGYSTWVWGWSPALYPAAEPPADVIDFGLPEGVLEPGGKASGYLYFQRSDVDAQQLQLVWNAVKASDGQPVGAARLDLEIQR